MSSNKRTAARVANQNIPETGFLRQRQILGDANADPPVTPIVPVGKSSWWAGIKTGKYPKPVKHGRLSLWRVEDIRELIAKISGAGAS